MKYLIWRENLPKIPLHVSGTLIRGYAAKIGYRNLLVTRCNLMTLRYGGHPVSGTNDGVTENRDPLTPFHR